MKGRYVLIVALSLGSVSAFVLTATDISGTNTELVIVPSVTSNAPASAPTLAAATTAPTSLSGTVYVDCSASVQGDGSSQSPFNSVSPLNVVAQPGTSILFRRGARCYGQLLTKGSGTSANPIRIAAYGTGTARPIIDGNGVSGLYAAGAAVLLNNQEYWRIDDIEVVNRASATGIRNGILVLLNDFSNGVDANGRPQGVGRGIYINNVYVHDVTGGGGTDETQSKSSAGIQFAVIGTGLPNWFDDIQVSNSRVSNVDRTGLMTYSEQKCRAYFLCQPNLSGSAPFNAWKPSTRILFKRNQIDNIGGDGIVIRVASGALVQDSEVFDVALKTWANNGSSVGVWAINSDNTEFSFNEVYRVRKLAGNNDGTAFDADFTNSGILFKQNYSHDNEGGFMLLCGSCGEPRAATRSTGIVVRDNISINDGAVSGRLIFAVGAGYRDTDNSIKERASFIGNDFYITRTAPIGIFSRSSYSTFVTFKNNILYSSGTITPYTAAAGSIDVDWDRNIFVGMAAASAPNGSLLVDPGWAGPLPSNGVAPTGYAGLLNYRRYSLLNGFRLGAGSQALSQGALVYTANVGDFFGGTKRPTRCRPDIGAHQATIASADCL